MGDTAALSSPGFMPTLTSFPRLLIFLNSCCLVHKGHLYSISSRTKNSDKCHPSQRNWNQTVLSILGQNRAQIDSVSAGNRPLEPPALIPILLHRFAWICPVKIHFWEKIDVACGKQHLQQQSSFWRMIYSGNTIHPLPLLQGYGLNPDWGPL